MKKVIAGIIASLVLTGVAEAKQASFLCRAKDRNEFIDVVSTGSNRVLVQINGGDFLDGEAEFEDPTLFVYVPLTNGVFALAFNVRSMNAGYMAKINGVTQTNELDCKFRD